MTSHQAGQKIGHCLTVRLIVMFYFAAIHGAEPPVANVHTRLQMVPIHDRVLIKPMEEEKKTAGGILLPKGPPKANSDAHIGEVLAIGDEVKLQLSKGDFVVFQKYAMAEVEIKDGQVLFVAEKSILGKLDPR
ncbi:hypothetical protein QJQ45_015311 [Haematococcus lacustris]|nr:hypothetical protein QJQ45_015311 [Haematococcus lacustris]